MKNLKPIQFLPFLLVGIFSLLLVSCGEISTPDSEAVSETVEAIVEKVAEATTTETTEDPPENQEIHVLKRSDNFLDFAHFGHFDLAHWEVKDESNDSGGDAEIKTKVYSKGGQTIEVSESDMGERGYSHTQVIKNDKGEVLKKRSFSFETDPELKLVEEVFDYAHGQKFSREQKMDKHFLVSNEKPTFIIQGDFKQSKI